jgi:hypothetical protein
MHPNRKREPRQSSFRGLFNQKKQNARKRGILWCLSFEQFMYFVDKPCHWCKIEPFERYNVGISKNGYTQRVGQGDQLEHGWVKYNGLDRIDNAKGYEFDNLLPCCKWCNFARSTRTVQEFTQWINRLKTIS